MNHLLAVLISVLVLHACQQEPETGKRGATHVPNGRMNGRLVASALTDTLFKEYVEAQASKRRGLLADRYTISHFDKRVFDAGKASIKSQKDLVQLYARAGVNHADEYVKSTNRILFYSARIRKKYPEFFQLSFDQRQELLALVEKSQTKIDNKHEAEEAFRERARAR